MQIEDNKTNQLADIIESSSHIAIIPSKIGQDDSFAAAVGLYYALLQKYSSEEYCLKDFKFIFFGKVPDGCKNLIQATEIADNLDERDLIVSIDYSGTYANKVHYSTENDILQVKISPVPKDYELSRIRSKVVGFNFDLIITIGARELEDLGPIYSRLKDEIHSAKVINFDNSNANKRFGTLNIIDAEADTFSSLIFKKLSELSIVPNKKAATALLYGITYREGVSVN